MASDPQGTLLSAKQLAAMLLQQQEELDALMTNLQKAMIQLTQQLMHDLLQPSAAPQLMAQHMLLHSRDTWSENVEKDQFSTFSIQCEMFMACKLVEFSLIAPK